MNYRKAKRGDIFYISNSKFYSTDPTNEAGRPGIIVSNDNLNSNAEVVEVVYLTTKIKKPMPTHVNVFCKASSTALCETIYTITKDRLGDYIRTCTEAEMNRIDKAMLCSLGISLPSPSEETISDSTPIAVERNLYKKLYEQLLSKVVSA